MKKVDIVVPISEPLNSRFLLPLISFIDDILKLLFYFDL